ncbi:MAG: VOC family protein [Planctomycetota bacterium]|jgi:catechol 2,3-dioxygenase-like lactoylglutathione lyase family enzyme
MKRHIIVIAIVACLGVCFVAGAARTGSGKVGFTRSTIDLGMVVSDVEAAAKFYTEAVGFTEVGGFSVSPEMAGDSGLTDYKPFKVRTFVLAEEETATRLKIMEIPGANSKKVDNQFISSSLGYSYLTLRVADMAASVERAKNAGVQPVKEPYKLGGNNYLTLVKDPDGNIVEFVGPMK